MEFICLQDTNLWWMVSAGRQESIQFKIKQELHFTWWLLSPFLLTICWDKEHAVKGEMPPSQHKHERKPGDVGKGPQN